MLDRGSLLLLTTPTAAYARLHSPSSGWGPPHPKFQHVLSAENRTSKCDRMKEIAPDSGASVTDITTSPAD